MTFYEFICKYADSDTPRGDLSRDIRADDHWPYAPGYSPEDKMIFKNYMKAKGCSKACIHVFDNAWLSYIHLCKRGGK